MYLTVKSKTGVPYREDREKVYLTVNSKKGVPYREERFFGGGEELRQFPIFLTRRSLLLEYFILIALSSNRGNTVP